MSRTTLKEFKEKSFQKEDWTVFILKMDGSDIMTQVHQVNKDHFLSFMRNIVNSRLLC